VPLDVAARGAGRGEGNSVLDGDLVGVRVDGDLGGLACVRAPRSRCRAGCGTGQATARTVVPGVPFE
jgi:hypothetical protein